MLDVHLYGRLRRLAPDSRASYHSIVQLIPERGETVESLLARLDLTPDDVFHIFVNGRLLATHNRMAQWLEYPQVRPDALEWDLGLQVHDGDRVGLFGPDMSALLI